MTTASPAPPCVSGSVTRSVTKEKLEWKELEAEAVEIEITYKLCRTTGLCEHIAMPSPT